ncbi:MAG TPA: hypothetical protein VFG10_19105 [Saprospiraceae bacterium]|nr:hypothetical protein [Saprospiraceae bacterium]
MPVATPRKSKASKKLYRIDQLIESKALKTGKKASVIRAEALKILKVSDRQFRNIRMAKQNSSGYLKTDQLLALSTYFEVGIDDLVNH